MTNYVQVFKVYQNKDELSEHEAMGGCGFACEPCGMVYSFEADLKQHFEIINVILGISQICFV